jgi:hypothetical protein
LQLVKKFPAFYGTHRFIIAVTSAATCLYPELAQFNPHHHIPLPEDPTYYYPPFYAWVSTVVFPSSFITKTLYTPHPTPTLRIPAPCPVHFIFITCTIVGKEYRLLSSSF